MRSDKTIARLNPKPNNFMGVPGGQPEYTTADLAAKLHNATDYEFYCGLAKNADSSLIQTLVGLLYRDYLPELTRHYQLNENERQRGAGEATESFEYKLIQLAVTEYCSDGRCSACSGTMFIKARGCPTCKGTGFVKLDDRQKAFYLKLTPKRFKYWKSLYEDIYSLCRDWDSAVQWQIRQG